MDLFGKMILTRFARVQGTTHDHPWMLQEGTTVQWPKQGMLLRRGMLPKKVSGKAQALN